MKGQEVGCTVSWIVRQNGGEFEERLLNQRYI
jgi:hypothetical protein